jgi:hypothetical protein
MGPAGPAAPAVIPSVFATYDPTQAAQAAADQLTEKATQSTQATPLHISETAYDAMSAKQRSDFLQNVQKIVRNELLATRATQPVTNAASNAASNATSNATSNANGSAMLAQGNEYNLTSMHPHGEEECDDDDASMQIGYSSTKLRRW